MSYLFIISSDLLSRGAEFNINQENLAETLDQDIFDEAGSDDDDYDSNEENDNNLTPWEKSFDELKLTMVQVPNIFGIIHKRIITDGVDDVMGQQDCRMQCSYSMFCENEKISFDSKPKPITVIKSEVLLGMQAAFSTMRKKEEAHFIIEYKLMFGEMGCPPRIKPRADILLVARLIDFVEVGNENACDDLSEEDRRKFRILKDKIDEMYKKSLDHYRNKRYKYSIKVGHQIVRHLEFCQVADETEQVEQQRILNDLYIHLSACYFKAEDWKKTCLMVNELRRRGNVDGNVTILFYEAIALSHIENNFRRSIELLRSAQKIEPNNELVNRTLNEILAKEQKYEKEQKEMWQRVFKAKINAEDKSN